METGEGLSGLRKARQFPTTTTTTTTPPDDNRVGEAVRFVIDLVRPNSSGWVRTAKQGRHGGNIAGVLSYTR